MNVCDLKKENKKSLEKEYVFLSVFLLCVAGYESPWMKQAAYIAHRNQIARDTLVGNCLWQKRVDW